jgi:hypothetical protein
LKNHCQLILTYKKIIINLFESQIFESHTVNSNEHQDQEDIRRATGVQPKQELR